MYLWAGFGVVLCGFLLNLPDTVHSEQNNAPQVTVSPKTLFVKEDEELGSVIGTLTGVDDDDDVITFSITDSFTNEYIQLGETVDNVVDLILIKHLDRETLGASVVMRIMFTDGIDELEKVLTVLIREVNDEPPEFENTLQIVEVHENAVVDHSVIKLKANDSDLGDFITYTMEALDESYGSVFEINPNTGEVILKTSLDFETHSVYIFSVYAEDRKGHRSEIPSRLIIKVIDIQDMPPVFHGLPYIVSIAEDTAIHDPVLKVTAEDGDRGVNNDITYQFVEPNNHFVIDENTGQISVAASLDRDEGLIHSLGGVFHLNVEATEVESGTHHGNSSVHTTVIVNILDVNDNYPEFSSDQYEARVPENSLVGVAVTLRGDHTEMHVKDLDQGDNSHFELTVEKDGAVYEDFVVVPSEVHSSAVVQILVANSNVLDFETTTSITFQVVATEKNTAEKHSRSTTVTLHIDNKDDVTHPQFTEESYESSVAENAVDVVVTQVEATSATGDVEYSIHGHEDKFAISQTGEVTLIAELDRETKHRYFMFVEAKDSNNIMARVELVVHVTDVNDEKPVFKSSHYYGTVVDGVENLVHPIAVEAVDNDEPETDSSRVRYVIHSQPESLQDAFAINSETGEITLNHAINLDDLDSALEGKIPLVIHAHDLGDTQQSSPVDVTIDVIASSSPSTGESTSGLSDEDMQMVLIVVAVVLALGCLCLGIAVCVIKQRHDLRVKAYGSLPSTNESNLRRSDMPTTNQYATGNSNPLYGHPNDEPDGHRRDPESLDHNVLVGDRIHRRTEDQQATMNFYSDDDGLTNHSDSGSTRLQAALDMHKQQMAHHPGAYATTSEGHEYIRGNPPPIYIPPVAL